MVTVAKVSVARYAIAAPAYLGGERRGLHLLLSDEQGRVGVGDGAPLKGFCAEDLAEVHAALEALAARSGPLIGRSFEAVGDVASLLSILALPPTANHAVDQALLSLLANARGLHVCELVTDVPRRQVSLSELVEDAVEARRSTAGCVKLKVARESLAVDQQRIANVREAIGPRRRLRLDANGGWSLDAAQEALSRFSPYGIECVEQPVAEIDDLAKLRRRSSIPIAADESLRDLDDLARLTTAAAADVAVIKPMFCGGLLAALSLAQNAVVNGLKLIVTTSFESSVGRRHALDLAASVPGELWPSGLQLPGASVDPLLVDGVHSPPQASAKEQRSRR